MSEPTHLPDVDYIHSLETRLTAAEERAEKAEARVKELERWEDDAKWQGEITKALLPYQDRAVVAEAREAALVETLKTIECESDDPDAVGWARAALASAGGDHDK